MLARLVMVWACLCSTEGAQIERVRNCGKRDLCNGRDQPLLGPPDLMTASQKKNIQCFCDEKCSVYGDCCIDVATFPFQKTSNQQCVPLSFHKGIYAISNCLSDTSLEVENLCKKSVNPGNYHYILDLPVYSNRSKQHYANIYCAMCNEESSSDIEALAFAITCKNGSLPPSDLELKDAYQYGKLSWILDDSECYLVQNDTRGRECTVSVDSCPDSTDLETSMKCSVYSLPLVLEDDKIYKNAHCAMCNGVNHTSLSCWREFQYRGIPSLSIIYDFHLIFDHCDVPEIVWDAVLQHCTRIYPKDNNNVTMTCENGIQCYQPVKEYYMNLSLKIEGYLTVISLSASIICLFLHILLSFFLPFSKNVPGKILNSLSISLLTAQVLFLCGLEPIVSITEDACQAVAVLIQFSFLSSFFWMNVMSIDIWQTFSNASFKGQTGRSHTKYAFYAWGGAGLVSCLSITADLTDIIPKEYRPYFAAVPNLCWFANRNGLAIFFFLPICILLFLNILLFTVTICWFQKQHSQSDLMKSSGRKEYLRLWLYIKLFIIMGLTWCCGMVTSLANKPSYRYPFILLNGLQGTFLFIMFDLKTEILQEILKKVGVHYTQHRDGVKSKNCNSSNSSKINSSNHK